MKKNRLFGTVILIVGIMLVFAFTVLSLTGCDIPNSEKDENSNGNGNTTQTPTAYDFNISGAGTVYFDGDYKSATVTPKSGKTTGAVTVYYEGTDKEEYPKTTNEPLFFGTYAVTFDVAAAAGWNAASGLSAGTLTVSDGTPATPSGVNIAIASTTSLKVSWTTVTRAASYKVYYITEGMEELALAGTVTGNSYTHNGLTLNLEDIYFYYITAVNTYGESDYSTFKSVVIDKPLAPLSVVATAASSSKINLQWSTVTGATGYKVRYNTTNSASGGAELPDTFTSASTPLDGAQPNTTYYFFVKAINPMGESDYSPSASAKTFASNYTLGLTASSLSVNSTVTAILVQWGRTNNVLDQFDVYCSIGSPDNFQLLKYNALAWFYDFNGSPNTTYYFYVKHRPWNDYYGNYEREGHSEIIMLRTGNPPPPPPPTPPTPLPPKATTPPSDVVTCTKCDGIRVCTVCTFGIYETKYGLITCPICKGTYKCPRCKGLGKY
jgi:hypothetical protein